MQGDVPQQRQISSGLKTYSSEYVILSCGELLVNFPSIISLFPLFICFFFGVVVVLFVRFLFGWVFYFSLCVVFRVCLALFCVIIESLLF